MATNDKSVSETQSMQVKLVRSFTAATDVVFKAWSSSEHVRRWFCPEGYTVPLAKVELRVGGAFDVCMRSPQGVEHWMRGRFTEVVPNTRLVFESKVSDPSGHALFLTQTEVDFAVECSGTRLEVTQRYTVHDPAAVAMIQGATMGWNQTLDRLARVLPSLQEGDGAPRHAVHGSFSLERIYPSTPACVWKAFTDAEAKAKWFAGTPGQWTLMERHMDVRPGGRERLQGRWEAGMVTTFDAVYHDVIPHERLVYTYEMHLGERKISVSLATIQISAEGGKTRVRVTEQGAFLDGYDDNGSREHGTGELLDRLGTSLLD
ncbi:MAG: SRPBCC domain-containing protein [Burkholderiales bacterium]|nr:SRPBCC domain-containing protein [Burkholderiales bacterium]